MQNKSLKRRIADAVRDSEWYWRYVANFEPWLNYRFCSPTERSETQKTLVAELRRRGVAITHANALFGNMKLFNELDLAVQELERNMANELDHARQSKNEGRFKTYLMELLGPRPVLDPRSIFVRIALAPIVLSVANDYFGMLTRLRAFNVWHNFASSSSPRNSQLWHRDPEDRYILKMFVYLSEVDDGAGPLYYAPNTHARGAIKSEPLLFKEEGTTARRADDLSMNMVVEKEKWVKAIGSKGTIVFVDTRGYHKGGLARTHDRIAYNCMFTSPMSTRGDYFDRSTTIPPTGDRRTDFALHTTIDK